MRRSAALLLLSFALAAPAAAQSGRITVVKPPEASTLRGPVSPAVPAAAPPEMVLPLPVQPTSLAASPADARRCRLNCSQTYYFCLTTGDDLCPQRWTRCAASCR